MSLAILKSRALAGMEAPEVTVEVHIANGLPAFTIVGLPDTEVKEAKDRVRDTIQNAHFDMPAKRITVNLALAELKEAAYDLGCNAVIGVDFDYITLEPETANSKGGTTYLPYVFCVTANGNAVVIEKDDDK